MNKRTFDRIKEGLDELRGMLRRDPKSVAEIAHEQMTDEQKSNLRKCYRAYLSNKNSGKQITSSTRGDRNENSTNPRTSD